MPRSRFQNLDPEKRRAILDAAAEEFAANGYENASYNQIIEKTGISKGAMYYYFDDKADLYATVLRDKIQPILGMIKELPDIQTPEKFWETAEQLLKTSLRFTIDHPVLLGLVRSAQKFRFEEIDNPAVGELVGATRDWGERFLRLGQEIKAVRTDIPFDLLVRLTISLDDAWDRWIIEQLNDVGPSALEEWAPTVLDLYRRLVEDRSTGEETG